MHSSSGTETSTTRRAGQPSPSPSSGPAVSVVIPAYNAAAHIGEALRSICDQTLRDVEVIVVDDGSSDGTVREVEAFASELNLVLIRQKNGGASAARNTGILRARGRYCAFLDADDLMLPERLEAEAQLLDAEPDLALVHTDLMTFDERGTIHPTAGCSRIRAAE